MRVMKSCFPVHSRIFPGLRRISKLFGACVIPSRRGLVGAGLMLAFAWGSAGTASAQYAYGQAYEAGNVSDETLLLVEEAVDAATDELYEALAGELECANALDVTCTLSLPVTGPGSACSCSASGPNAPVQGRSRTAMVWSRTSHARTDRTPRLVGTADGRGSRMTAARVRLDDELASRVSSASSRASLRVSRR